MSASESEPGSWFSSVAADAVGEVLEYARAFGAAYGRDPEVGSIAYQELNHSHETGADGRPWPRKAATPRTLRRFVKAGLIMESPLGKGQRRTFYIFIDLVATERGLSAHAGT
jgi:hypothetical protein